MSEHCEHIHTVPSNYGAVKIDRQYLLSHYAAREYDPTHTLTLRNAFSRQMRVRFDGLKAAIIEAVDKNDVFGLRGNPNTLQSNAKIQSFEIPQPGAFAFPRDPDKIAHFNRWLQKQVDKGILTTGELSQIGTGAESSWTNKYIFDSYKRGVIRARYELKKAGYDVPSLDQTGGVELSMSTPFHIDRLGLLYTRTFQDLQGITAEMDTKISRILAQGLGDGDGPALLARKMVSVIDGSGAGTLGITDFIGRFIPAKRRAETLARTEVIRAHHQATIQEYRNWGTENVIVYAEWSTAGDNRVCPQCADLNGSVFTLDQIEKLIPLHPNCRCIALPYKATERTILISLNLKFYHNERSIYI